MKPDDLKKLFSAFGKLDDKSSINKNGLGLGLNICKNITQQEALKCNQSQVKDQNLPLV